MEQAEASAINLHVMSIKEFNKTIQENKLLIDLGKNAPLNTREQDLVSRVRGYATFSTGGVVSRSIKDFKGETLLVGGGKAGGLGY